MIPKRGDPDLAALALQIRAVIKSETSDPAEQLNRACALAAAWKLEYDQLKDRPAELGPHSERRPCDETLYRP